jgi:hypothetical protein
VTSPRSVDSGLNNAKVCAFLLKFMNVARRVAQPIEFVRDQNVARTDELIYPPRYPVGFKTGTRHARAVANPVLPAPATDKE